MPRKVNLIKIKCVDQIFELGYKLKKEDYWWAASKMRKKMMTRIKGREPEEEDLAIPPIKFSFAKVANVMQPNK